MALRSRRRSIRDGFLSDYQESETYLLKPAPATGRPGMLEAISPNGDAVLVRVWPRRTQDDKDLVDIWHHELRQLHRLAGYPGAEQLVARVVDAGSDAKGFYIVLDAGQRRPLELLLERGRGSTDWLRALNLAANRFRLWTNLKRVARGLEILHNEGLVHRNLDGWAILTSAGDDPDFQLTGFEWSLRLMTTSDAPKAGRVPVVPNVSFAADWAAFAGLAARVFNINSNRLNDGSIPDYAVHESASALEARLLRDLMLPNELPRLDGELVSNRIDQLLSALDASRSADDGRYHLALRLSRDSDLSRKVRECSDLTIELEDVTSQLRWIEADLGETITLLMADDSANASLFLRGRELVYRLKQYRGVHGDLTWQFAFCESAEFASAPPRLAPHQESIPSAAIRLIAHNEAWGVYQRTRGRTPSWSKQLDRLQEVAPEALTRGGRLHRAFTLLHGLEVAFAAASVFPVTVQRVDANIGTVELTFRSSGDGEELSTALGLAPPFQRLREGLEMEELGEGEGWTLSEVAHLGQGHVSDVDLTFEGAETKGEEARFRFRLATQAAVVMDEGYLVPTGSRGDFIQFRRRSRAIRLLKDHTELLESLADPRGRLVPTHDVVEEDHGYHELDDAKQKSLRALLAILPMFLLQGPPGVGKTYLIKDLIRRRFEKDDRSERLLITAQGNHALDHLLDELGDLWDLSSVEPPLIVRCRPKDDKVAAGAFDLHKRTAMLVDNLANTPLANVASPAVKDRLFALAGRGKDSASTAGERRSLQGLMMRSANLVFATTNSGDLERLVEERGQFDWTIVEEAGKATGCELVTPLMLSHRRLLIGDHKQLPPFGSQELEKLLGNAAAVRNALTTLTRVIDRTVRSVLDDDLLEFLEDETQDVESLCAEAIRALYLFETALTTELGRQKSNPSARPIADTLTVQHRMHPIICGLVSRTFYNGTLATSEKRTKSAAKQERWIVSSDSGVLPDLPFVFIDMPYERSASGQTRFEKLPRFSNNDEVRQVVSVISKLRVVQQGERPPTLAILAPYAKQVSKLKEALFESHQAMAALNSFRAVARGHEWCSTVDAFQGNEADVVVFSLVRNNRGATIKRALGFVGDQRRFNVLLSRARQRLIFVGSLEFLRTISEPLGLERDASSAFLRRFVSEVDELIKRNPAHRADGELMRKQNS